jgi:hypothetical protein
MNNKSNISFLNVFWWWIKCGERGAGQMKGSGVPKNY